MSPACRRDATDGTHHRPGNRLCAATPQDEGDHWIDDWRPEDPVFWETITGRSPAVIPIFHLRRARRLQRVDAVEHRIVQMTAAAPGTPPSGWAPSASQALCLVAVPSGVGAFLRLPYTFAIPIFAAATDDRLGGAVGDPVPAAGLR